MYTAIESSPESDSLQQTSQVSHKPVEVQAETKLQLKAAPVQETSMCMHNIFVTILISNIILTCSFTAI